jgi:glucose/arabinose dehydrogenase
MQTATTAPPGQLAGRRQWLGLAVLALPTLRGQQLRRIHMDGDRVVTDEPVLTGRFGRIRIAAEGPDGALYLLTSNRNLGTPRSGDDQVLRLAPPRPTVRG